MQISYYKTLTLARYFLANKKERDNLETDWNTSIKHNGYYTYSGGRERWIPNLKDFSDQEQYNDYLKRKKYLDAWKEEVEPIINDSIRILNQEYSQLNEMINELEQKINLHKHLEYEKETEKLIKEN